MTRTTRSHALKAKQSEESEPWDIKEARWFEAAEKHDKLLKLPTPATSVYLDKQNRPKFDNRYEYIAQRQAPTGENHPKLLRAKQNGTWNRLLQYYYEHFDSKINIPLAGASAEPAFVCLF
jgi:mortality factor 4-like protein 1